MDEIPDTFATNMLSKINLTKFGENRRKEIEIMKRALAASGSGTKLTFQRLPKHMRRRTMSHNAKRLPRRLREIHLNQMKKSGLPPKLKRPSRKYRRKPRNLLEEYTKRQTKFKWLNTHIWHAKRFHMVEKWGYKLPYRPCDKAFTACYRATKNYCLVQDISYFQCIEIVGKYKLIVEGFDKITDKTIGLSIGSKAFAKGTREGEIILYQFGNDHKRPIGPVQFLWKHQSDETSLWLWVHAAYYDEVFNTLSSCFNIVDSNGILSNGLIILRELRNELSRFRLAGNLSNTILNRFLKIHNNSDCPLSNFMETSGEFLSEQNNFWNNIKDCSVSNLPPHIVLPLIVRDPRLTPARKEQLEDNFNTDITAYCQTLTSVVSPLWDQDLRKKINESKVSNKEITKIQESCLIPSSINSGSPVGIILVQKPGSRDNLGYSSGWDIILPASWAQPFWIALIMNGARSGGLREFHQNNFEIGTPSYLYPDTTSGEIEELQIKTEYTNTYFKKPPNKRTNYNKMKIVSPFFCNWKLLIQNWLQRPIDYFTVLRDRKQLVLLQQCIQFGRIDVEIPDNCLIPVKVECKSKGCPKKFTIICIPKLGDLKKSPVESTCVDLYQASRKVLRKEHKVMLKRLRQRRRKTKMRSDDDDEKLAKYSIEMKKLWLPEVDDIKNSCSRTICGFVSEGGFSYVLGNTKGIGYIVGAAIKTIINSGCKDNVLLRNTNSRQYYTAKLSVIVDL